MLVRNGRTIFQNPGVFSGSVYGQPGNILKAGGHNRMVGGLSETFGGYANGHLAPSSFILPTKAGSISSYTEASASISPGVIILVPAKPMEGSGSLTLTASTLQLDKIIAMIASGTLALVVDSSLLSSAVSAIASGSMTISGSGIMGGVFQLSASGSLILIPNTALSALALMVAEAGGPEDLTPQGLANAVWERAMDNGVTAEEIMRILVAIAAGKTEITGSNVTFRDLGDSKNRVAATMTGSERTTVTLDLD